MALAFIWSDRQRAATLHQPTAAARLLDTSLSLLTENVGSGRWMQGGAGLAASSDGILPEDRFDRQPCRATDDSVILVCDLRLDNRTELTKALGMSAENTLSDADTLLQAWIRWGESVMDHLAGPFAFAVWQSATQTLFAARDQTGGRPLFFHDGPEYFALASSVPALLRLQGISHDLDRDALVNALLILDHPAEKTLFPAISRVPPGHWLRVTPDSVQCGQYWSPADARPVRFKRDQDYAEAFLEVVDRAVEGCLRATTPIACELSAGLDSSTVAATAAHLLARSGGRLQAFTAVPRPEFARAPRAGRLWSEGPAAAQLAGAYANIDHHLVTASGLDLVANNRRWAGAQGDPPFNPVNYLWVTEIREQARAAGCRVLLTGAKGNAALSFDTLFGLRELFRQGRWGTLLSTSQRLRRRGETSGRRTLWYALHGLLPAAALRRLRGAEWPVSEEPTLDYTLIRPELQEVLERRARLLADEAVEPPSLRAQQAFFWRGIDNAASRMASMTLFGIDERDPTADRRLWEFVHGVPAEQFIVGGETRSLLRRAMRGRLPESTRMRYDYGQQGADWNLILAEARPALRAELVRLRESALVRELIDVEGAEWMLDHWPAADDESVKAHTEWHMALTRGMSVASFIRDHDGSLG